MGPPKEVNPNRRKATNGSSTASCQPSRSGTLDGLTAEGITGRLRLRAMFRFLHQFAKQFAQFLARLLQVAPALGRRRVMDVAQAALARCLRAQVAFLFQAAKERVERPGPDPVA